MRIRVAALLCLAMLPGSSAPAQENTNRWRSGFPGSKMAIETPLKKLISGSFSGSIEAKEAEQKNAKYQDSSAFPDSKTIKAGLISWRPNFEAACALASKSKKPVLVFQLMGNLDEEFC
ncbi:MAG: hypothetical protein K2X27_00655 [Candidatus Obscuribacterales bacterium]|nr:hypothetical protein [Candidatus Obscuribacterales bacterium]